MSSHEDGTRSLWESVVLVTPTKTIAANNETIPVCVHTYNSQGQEVLSCWYRVTRAALFSSPSAALASLDGSNQVILPPGVQEEEISQINFISVGEYMGDEDADDGHRSVEGLENVRVGKGLGLDNPCPICLDELEIWSEATKTPCNHVFHTNCIMKWMEKSGVCPLCRYKIPNHDLEYLKIFPDL